MNRASSCDGIANIEINHLSSNAEYLQIRLEAAQAYYICRQMGSVDGPVSKDVAWYAKELPPSFPLMREVLEKYSEIPADQVDDHIKRVVRTDILPS
jgi:hypothetical protein